MKTTEQKIPALRFPEFEGEWEEKKLGDVSKKGQYGLNTSGILFDGSNQYIRITDIDESSNQFINNNCTSPKEFSNEYLLQENDLLFARTGASVGKSYLYKKQDGKIYFAGFLIRFQVNKANSKFTFYNTLRDAFAKWVSVMSIRSGQPGINAEEYSNLKISFPSLPEQQKIADFLSATDKRLELLKEKKKCLEDYKRGAMQRIFSQELRFTQPDGSAYPDWEEKKLGEMLIQHSERNKRNEVYEVLSVSNTRGFIRQQEQFENHRVASLDTSNYKIVKKGWYAYNPSRINVGSIAVLLDFPIGIVSPMYIIFELKKMLNSAFFKNIIQTHYYKHLIQVGCSGSVRESLNFTELEKMNILLPSLSEQTQIANFLSAIDSKIDKLSEQIASTESYKKGLLQQMFV